MMMTMMIMTMVMMMMMMMIHEGEKDVSEIETVGVSVMSQN